MYSLLTPTPVRCVVLGARTDVDCLVIALKLLARRLGSDSVWLGNPLWSLWTHLSFGSRVGRSIILLGEKSLVGKGFQLLA